MKTQAIQNQNFNGKLVILNKLSNKPSECIKKSEKNLQKLIKPKNYDLYVEQDYSKNKIRIGVSSFYPSYIDGVIVHKELPVTANYKRYIYAAQNAIDEHEKSLNDIKQKMFKEKQKQQKLKDMAINVIRTPLYITGIILEDISPKLAKKFDKLLDKLGNKLGIFV